MAAVIQEIRGEPGRHNDARLVRQTMKIGLTALTLPPACVLGVFFVKNRLRLIVDCRKANALFAPPPPVELLSGDGFSRIEADTSGLVHGESPGCVKGVPMLLTASTGCVSLERFAIFLLARGVEQVSQEDGSRRDQSFVQSNSRADVLLVTNAQSTNAIPALQR